MLQFIKSLGRLGKAKDKELSDKIESQNVVAFAEQDVDAIKRDHDKVLDNLGHVKGRMMSLQAEIADMQAQIKDHTDKATALIAKKTTDCDELAKQHCSEVETHQGKLAVLQSNLKAQEDLFKRETESEKKLKAALEEARSDLDIMRTQKEVADANQSLSTINTADTESALQRFKDRRKKLNEQLNYSTAKVEMSQDTSQTLEEKTKEAIGGGAGSDLFAKLKGSQA